MAKYVNHAGKVFGRLTALRKIGTKHECALWLCGCLCGAYTEKSTGELCRRKDPRTSCGFCQDHLAYPKEYLAWRNMKGRCDNPNDNSYSDYGARGITVCMAWRLEFFDFLIHIGLAPGPEYTVDRIDNNKGYEPGNVRWATRTIQNLNKRNITSVEAKRKYEFLLTTPHVHTPKPS